MLFGTKSVDSKAEKRPFLSHKTNNISHFVGSDPTGKNEVYDIFGAAIDVHKVLGPGFLEAVYQEAFELELSKRGIPFESQKKL
jgi:hypothetical protein